jgi:hypothetical protein
VTLDLGGAEQETRDDGCDQDGTDAHAENLPLGGWCDRGGGAAGGGAAGVMPSVLPPAAGAPRAVSLVRGRAVCGLNERVCESGPPHLPPCRRKRSQGRGMTGKIAVTMGGRQDNFLGPTCLEEPQTDTVA